MRREKILKIACNHAISTDMKLKPMQTSEVAWCWNAFDFAENEGKNEQFALKFKVMHNWCSLIGLLLISIDMKLKSMQTLEVAWCWNAFDFAENEGKNEQFALQFKVLTIEYTRMVPYIGYEFMA